MLTDIELARIATSADEPRTLDPAADEDLRRMSLIVWLFAALITVPILIVLAVVL